MEVLMLLIPMSVVLVALIGAVFWWSVRSGQFDDLEGPAHRILADDDRVPAATDAETGTKTSAKTGTKTQRDAGSTEQPPAL